MGALETYTGGFVDYDEPCPSTINIRDIARALSNVCRFGGHVDCFYSVAEHACLVRELVIRAGRPDLGFAALHHDSHEAFVGDIPTPLKRALGSVYTDIRDRLDVAIAEALSLPLGLLHDPVVVRADADALAGEAAVLKVSGGVGPHWGRTMPGPRPPWVLGAPPSAAERLFRTTHDLEVATRV